MPIDHVGSCVNLAKQMLMDMNETSLVTTVQTQTLRMILDMLIDLGSPQAPTMQAERARTVSDMIKGFDR